MKLLAITAGLLLAVPGGSACAMTTSPNQALPCTVEGADKLPAEIGGADAVCAAIREALGGEAGVSVAVRIISPYAAAALVTTADGRKLPQVNVSISDRALNKRSIDMLAQGVAGQLRPKR
jgi:hypothetical protein